MGDPREGAELTLTSGEGQCEMRVCDTDGQPQCHVAEPTGDVSLARLQTMTCPQVLNKETLQGARDRLQRSRELGEKLGSCLKLALENFRQEPRCVQENARLLIRWGGGELQFISGQGQCEISVLLANGEPQYHITALGGDMPATWSHTSPEPLSIADLVRVQDRLGRWGALGEELSSCFGEAISQFSREPPCVQGSARMGISWDGKTLEFLSGEGDCEISVCSKDGRPQYEVGELPMHMYLARLHTHPEPLSSDSLQRVLRKLGSCQEDIGTLRACISHAWDQFVQEPRCVQENARLLIRWGGGELEFVSGQGQCEISVLLADGKPQYHITELGGDRPATWSHTSPEPLSVADLERMQDRLGRWGALGEKLSSCLKLALENFRQEPRCVQENARLLIRWGGGELEFISGKGQCETSVLLTDGKPQYHITELGGDRPVTWSHTSPEPLSVADLVRVWDRLGRWGALGEELSSCFGEAISQFSREPPCVQENARMRLCWDGGSLEFLSGQGQYMFSVSYQEGNPCYHFHVETLPVHLYVARLRSRKDPLSADSLLKFYTELGLCRGDTAALRACFYRVWEGFSREPRCVQENARLLIRWDGQELEFVSGQGQCEISVLLADGEPQYHITELGGDRPVTWSHTSPEPLSVADLVRVQERLGRWGALGEELSSCLEEAISQFSREPPCVKENARMGISWDGKTLEFLSGEGDCEISVCSKDGRPQYEVGELPMHMYLARLRTHPEPLSTDSLQRVLRKLGSCQEDTFILRACISHALNQFVQEPRCVQENTRLLIRWGGGELEFISGQGQCEISVLLTNEELKYHITELGEDRAATWSHTSPEPLSVADLVRVWDRLGRWGALGEELSSCLGEAISQFSQEPPCVQENARMRIRWDGGTLELLSGEGQCEISVHYRDGRPQYEVGELAMHMYLARLRTHPEPLSADSLQRVLRKLGSCQEDTGTPRACISHALNQFVQEPRCVQENARLLIRWDGQELEFVSSQGQCEISVLLADGEPQYHITELGGDRPVTWSHTSPEPLSIADLARVRDRLRRWQGLGKELRSCLGEAISQFIWEPRCVQENARLLIRWDGQELEFVSGQGQCEISVLLADGEPQYHITELGGDRPVTWSHTSPEPLSIANLARVWDRLGRWGVLGEELSGCLGEAISQFSQEPPCVQKNARMGIRWDGGTLEFLSGKGQCEIFVRYRDGRPQYEVGELPVHMYVARLHTHPEPLSADSLQRVLRKLGSYQEDTGTPRACISHALNQFIQEPRCVQENARLLIRWGSGEMKFVSGQGENLITVCEGEEGRFQYMVQVSGWSPWIARLLP